MGTIRIWVDGRKRPHSTLKIYCTITENTFPGRVCETVTFVSRFRCNKVNCTYTTVCQCKGSVYPYSTEHCCC
jgi:hypothetical protein